MKVGIRATTWGIRTQIPGQASTHFEVVQFCSKAKNTGSTPHGPLPLTVLLRIEPRVHKLEGGKKKKRGPFSCIPEDRTVFLNLASAKYHGKTSDSRTSFARRQVICGPGTRGLHSSSSKFPPHLSARKLLNSYLLLSG